jgi:predicted TIM-barrel fold metal-dependent hydrolase
MKGTGWEPLIHYGNSVLQDKILFGSTWLFMGSSIKKLAEGVMELPLKEEVKHKWLYHNAAKLLGIK